MSEFLKKLKETLENSEFNSDIAKKFNEINELADAKTKSMSEDELEKSIEARIDESGGVKTVSEEEVSKLNQEYEEKITKINRIDMINKEMALLIEIEDAVNLTIEDMFYHVDLLEKRYGDSLENNDDTVSELFEKIEKIKEKFKSIIN